MIVLLQNLLVKQWMMQHSIVAIPRMFGLSWLNIYLESSTVFMFGDGKLFKSLKSVNIPAKIGHENIKIIRCYW